MSRSQTSEDARRISQAIAALTVILLVLLACGSPGYWQGVSEGMAAGGSGYSSSTESDAQRREVCARYETRSGWSDGYSVEAVMTDGGTLNEKTGSYSYEPYAEYAVIFWGEDQASVLKLQSVTGEISSTGTRAVDQDGGAWRLSTSSLCY